jgi:hypothetical protein
MYDLIRLICGNISSPFDVVPSGNTASLRADWFTHGEVANIVRTRESTAEDL